MNSLTRLQRLMDGVAPTLAICAMVLILAALFGAYASPIWLVLVAVGLGAMILLQRPVLGLLAVVPVALILSLEFGTGTQVEVNPITLLVPVLLGLWLLDMVRRRELKLEPSRVNLPLLLFLLAGLLSLLVGNAIWDPLVPRSRNFLLVQAAQWAIFVFSAGVFWLMGNLVRDEVWLRRLTFSFLIIAGVLSLAIALSGGVNLVELGVATFAVACAPFTLLFIALAGGQLLFNRDLSVGWRLFLLAVLGAGFVNVFYLMREAASHWVGVVAVVGVLGWLRWPRLRWPVVILLVALLSTGILFSVVYNFAGGATEWQTSGGSRLALIARVLDVTMRNPITGLGPAAYRAYARLDPLYYRGAVWFEPNVSSHNTYIDLLSQTGLLGLGFFLWFVVELARLGLRLRIHFSERSGADFAMGYVNGILAAGAGALTVMLLADWILPFVYNIGFPGFQASILVWLFLGGLVALEQMLTAKKGEEVG